MLKVIKIFIKRTCIYMTGIAVYYCEVLQCYAFPQCHDIQMKKFFSGSLLFSVVALLNWFTKSSKFEDGFNDNELA